MPRERRLPYQPIRQRMATGGVVERDALIMIGNGDPEMVVPAAGITINHTPGSFDVQRTAVLIKQYMGKGGPT